MAEMMVDEFVLSIGVKQLVQLNAKLGVQFIAVTGSPNCKMDNGYGSPLGIAICVTGKPMAKT